MYRIRSTVIEIISMLKNNYGILYYKYNEVTGRDVKMTVKYNNENEETFKFNYNDILKCYILFFNKKSYISNQKYRFYFVINNKKVVDINFVKECYEGELYNILDVSKLKQKGYISNIVKSDGQSRRRYTMPDLEKAEKIKPILRKYHEHDAFDLTPRKRVSFNLTLNNTYL
jgi:hypothetical protein